MAIGKRPLLYLTPTTARYGTDSPLAELSWDGKNYDQLFSQLKPLLFADHFQLILGGPYVYLASLTAELKSPDSREVQSLAAASFPFTITADNFTHTYHAGLLTLFAVPQATIDALTTAASAHGLIIDSLTGLPWLIHQALSPQTDYLYQYTLTEPLLLVGTSAAPVLSLPDTAPSPALISTITAKLSLKPKLILTNTDKPLDLDLPRLINQLPKFSFLKVNAGPDLPLTLKHHRPISKLAILTVLSLTITILVGIFIVTYLRQSAAPVSTSPTPTPTATPTPTPTPLRTDLSQMSLTILNASGKTGAAAAIATRLDQLDFASVTVGNAAADATGISLYYRQDIDPQSLTPVLSALPQAATLAGQLQSSDNYDLLITVGK